MSTSKDILKTYFETGDFPTEAQFGELIDSFRHIDDGKVIKNFTINNNGDLSINLSSDETIQIDKFVLPSSMPVGFITGLQNIIDNNVTIGQLNEAIATSAYGIKYSWNSEIERNAQTKMKKYEQGVQKNTREVYKYTGSKWELFYTLDAIHNHDDRYYTEIESNTLFLGKTAKAIDSDKLDGLHSAAFAKASHTHTWAQITGVPLTFPASEHDHNDLYYTESESNTRFLGKTAKAVDSDKLDGLDSTGFAKQSTINLKTVAIGWYTVAVNAGNRASAKFVLADKTSSYHQTVHFYASHHYGRGNVLTVLSNSNFGNDGAYRYIRIKEGETYDGALLQVYVDTNATVQGLILENIQTSGWIPKDWILDGINPGNVKNFDKLTNIAAQIDLNKTQGIQSTEEIFVDNNKVYHLGHKPTALDVGALAIGETAANSDKLDGIDSSGFVRKGIDASGAWNSEYLLFNFTNENNVDAISYNDSTNGFYFNADRAKNKTSANAKVYANSFYENGVVLSSKYLGKTGKAADSDKLDGINSTSFFRDNANNIGQWQLASKIKNSGYASAALEVRELNFGGKQAGTNAEAPRISFHWGGRKASQIMLRTDSSIAIMNNPGTGYEHFRAANIYSNDALVATQEWSNAAFLGKTGKAVDSDKLDGYNSASGATANTIPIRDGAADIQARLFRSNYQTQASISSGATVTMRTNTSDNYLRHVTKAGFLIWLGRVNDANLLDGLDSTVFLRSNVDDSFSGKLVSTSRQGGIYGSYNSKLTDHIWSMGTAYKVAPDGSNFGNLYGLAYKHTNNPTGGTMAGGHQAVWCENGVPKAAMGGDGLWSAEKIIALGNITTQGNIYANGTSYNGDGKEIIRFSDSWLRLNASNQFTSGIYCATSVLRTDNKLEVGSVGSAFYANKDGDGKFKRNLIVGNQLTVGGHLYGRSVNGAYSHLYRFGGIHFTWDSDTYGTQAQHSIKSAYGTTMGDSLTMNSYNNIRLNIDSNNNNSNSKFEIGHNTSGVSNVLFSVDEKGTVRTTGDVVAYSTSDMNLKDNVKPISSPLMKINKLSGNEFKWNEKQTTYKEGSKDYGVIAQEVESILPEAVRRNEETGNLSVRYEKLIPLLIEGIKEQQEQIEELKIKLHGITN